MLPSLSSFHSPWQLISRQDLVLILQTALSVGSSRFARHAAYSWLAYFPGDLPVNKLYAQALYQAGQVKHSLNILENIVRVDPEYQEAWKDITRLLTNATQPPLPSSREAFLLADSQAAIHALGGSGRVLTPLPTWRAIYARRGPPCYSEISM